MNTQQDSVAVLRELIDTNMMDGSARRALHKFADALALQSQQGASADRGEAVDDLLHVIDRWCRPTDEAMGAIRAAINTALQATPPSPAASAAPSGVSDADVRWLLKEAKAGLIHAGAALGAQYVERDLARCAAIATALEAAKPQPGRVEGMVQDLSGAHDWTQARRKADDFMPQARDAWTRFTDKPWNRTAMHRVLSEFAEWIAAPTAGGAS